MPSKRSRLTSALGLPMPKIVTDLDRSRAITPARPWVLLLVAMFMVVSAACGVIGSDTAEAALDDEASQPTVEPVQLPEASVTPDVEPTSTAIPTPSAVPTTLVPKSTPTAVPVPATSTPTPTLAPTVVPVPLPTVTPIATSTAVATATPTVALALTPALTAPPLPSPTPFVTFTPTPMASPMPSPTSTPTPKLVPTVLLTNFPKASIMSYTPASATTVLVGTQASLGVTLKNTGTIAWQYVVEAVVLDDQGIVTGLFNTALPTALEPDAQTSVTWNVQVLQAGGYWVQYSVWKDSGQSEGNLLAVAPSTSIISYTPASLVTVTVGSQTSLSVTLKNTGTVAWQYVVEAEVSNTQGIVIGQLNTALPTALQPDAQTTVSWSVQVSQAGDSWAQYSVWKTSGRPETGLIDVKPFPSANLIVGQIPPPPTATPIPSPTPFPTSTPPPTATLAPTATPTPTPTPLLPPSPMASIVSYTPASLVTVLLGQQASLSVTFTNSGAVVWQFVAEATVWNAEGSVVGLFNTALGTALQPTKETTVSWSVGVLQAGDYWVQYSVRKTSGAGETSLLDQAPVPSVKLITGVAPTPTPTPPATATPTMTPVP